MPNLLNILRYFVFVVFLVCNAVITSVAVWNLSIIQAISSQANKNLAQEHTKEIDSLLIFVGASGLLLIFTVLFFELYGKNVFIGRVWFELVWVAVYCILELAGAASYTALSSSQTCDTGVSSSDAISDSVPLSSEACASTQVLQAFTWICATLLLGYFTFLAILTYVKRKDDPTIWRCSVRRFPVVNNHNLKSVPASPAYPRFRASEDDVPVIAAPQPRRAPGTRDHVLSYNSGLSYRSGLALEYEIEHYQSPESVLHATSTENHGTVTSHAYPTSPTTQRHSQTGQFTIAPVAPSAVVQPLRPLRPVEPVQLPVRQPVVSTPFYHTSVVSAVKDQRTNQPQAPAPIAVRRGGGGEGAGQVRRLPPSPPPLGDWPRLDATSRPARVKRKPLPRPEPEPEFERYEPEPEPEPEPEDRVRRPSLSYSQSQSRQERRVLPVPMRSFSQSRPQPQPPSELTHLSQSQSQPQPQSQPQVQRHMRPLPSTQTTMPSSSSSYPLDANALSAALHPLQVSQSMRSKPSRPSGPRRKSTSIDDGRPTDLELSRARTYQASGYS